MFFYVRYPGELRLFHPYIHLPSLTSLKNHGHSRLQVASVPLRHLPDLLFWEGPPIFLIPLSIFFFLLISLVTFVT